MNPLVASALVRLAERAAGVLLDRVVVPLLGVERTAERVDWHLRNELERARARARADAEDAERTRFRRREL